MQFERKGTKKIAHTQAYARFFMKNILFTPYSPLAGVPFLPSLERDHHGTISRERPNNGPRVDFLLKNGLDVCFDLFAELIQAVEAAFRTEIAEQANAQLSAV